MNNYSDIDAPVGDSVSVALIGPVASSRNEIAHELEGAGASLPNELPYYPAIDQVDKIVEFQYDVIMIDLDSDPGIALELVERLCASSLATVMLYSSAVDLNLVVRCMRAGARELLTIPLTPGALAEAINRVSVRRSASRPPARSEGKLFVFWGAKGGAGVTTISTNFAISIAKESGQKTLLIDLDLPLGDVALGLGITSKYSTVDAVQNFRTLDSNFLSRLVVKHSSGLFVLTAPGKLVNVEVSDEAVGKLITVARQGFDFVVVDSGSKFNLTGPGLFQKDAIVYLVSQVGISELRNANRIIAELFVHEFPRLEIVLNRFTKSSLGIDEEHITKALTRKAHWKISEYHATVDQMQNRADPLAMSDSPISREIRKMGRAARGLPAGLEKTKKS